MGGVGEGVIEKLESRRYHVKDGGYDATIVHGWVWYCMDITWKGEHIQCGTSMGWRRDSIRLDTQNIMYNYKLVI